MKKKLFAALLVAAAFTSNSYAQLRQIPSIVTDSFAKKYPGAANVAWADKVTGFEASFNLNEHKQHVTFTSKGATKKTDMSLAIAEVPATVIDGFQKSKYNAWEIISYEYVTETPNKIYYRIYVQKNDWVRKYLYFTKKGQLAKDGLTL